MLPKAVGEQMKCSLIDGAQSREVQRSESSKFASRSFGMKAEEGAGSLWHVIRYLYLSLYTTCNHSRSVRLYGMYSSSTNIQEKETLSRYS